MRSLQCHAFYEPIDCGEFVFVDEVILISLVVISDKQNAKIIDNMHINTVAFLKYQLPHEKYFDLGAVRFRLAKLSEGQLIDGRIECLYHGWQFEGDGKCVKIPQVCLSLSCPFFFMDNSIVTTSEREGLEPWFF